MSPWPEKAGKASWEGEPFQKGEPGMNRGESPGEGSREQRSGGGNENEQEEPGRLMSSDFLPGDKAGQGWGQRGDTFDQDNSWHYQRACVSLQVPAQHPRGGCLPVASCGRSSGHPSPHTVCVQRLALFYR